MTGVQTCALPILLDRKKIEHFKDLLLELIKKELKVRYKSSYLGYIWSILNPLALALVFFFAFKIIMRVKIENYALDRKSVV